MNWAGVIDRNSTALKAIIDSLFAMLGLATRLSPSVHCKMMRLLRPAESAVRRLIVIAARGVVAEVAPLRAKSARVKPAASVRVRPKATQRGYSFQLFDPRRRFAVLRRKKKVFRIAPRVHLFDYDPRVAALWPKPRPPAPPPAPVPDGLMDAARITRRLQALESALDDLPRQAQRLVRLQNKREASPAPVFKTPIRPGHPPGFRLRRRHEVHEILVECHYFALDALKINTS